jgi:hypothetical protein
MKIGPIRCPETSVNNYHTKPRNSPEDGRFHQHRGGSLKSKYRFLFHINLFACKRAIINVSKTFARRITYVRSVQKNLRRK